MKAELVPVAQAVEAQEFHTLRVRRAAQRRARDYLGLSETLRRMTALRPRNAELYVALARVYLRLHDDAAAEAAARSALALDATLPLAHRALFTSVLATDAEQVGKAIADAVATASAYPNFPGLFMALSGLESDQSKRLVALLVARWPESVPALGLPPSMTPGTKSVELNVASRAFRLALTGNRAAALAEFQANADRRDLAAIGITSETVAHLLSAIPGPEGRRRELIVDEGVEVTVSPRTASGTVVLFFTGLHERAAVDLVVIDAFCAKAGHAAIYLRDFSHNGFLMGIGSLAPDIEGTLPALRTLLASQGARRVIAMGASMGGFSAIRYGVALAACRT